MVKEVLCWETPGEAQCRVLRGKSNLGESQSPRTKRPYWRRQLAVHKQACEAEGVKGQAEKRPSARRERRLTAELFQRERA